MTYQIKQLEKYPAYYVSTEGEVFTTLDNSGKTGRMFKLRKQNIQADGYFQLELREGGKGRTLLVHRLILEAFVCKCPKGQETRHLNGNPEDNRLENLAWGTPKENHRDQVRHGNETFGAGEAHPFSKLTDRQARVVKYALHFNGKRPVFGFKAMLARMLGVDYSTVDNIATGRQWKHVKISEQL